MSAKACFNPRTTPLGSPCFDVSTFFTSLDEKTNSTDHPRRYTCMETVLSRDRTSASICGSALASLPHCLTVFDLLSSLFGLVFPCFFEFSVSSPQVPHYDTHEKIHYQTNPSESLTGIATGEGELVNVIALNRRRLVSIQRWTAPTWVHFVSILSRSCNTKPHLTLRI